MYRVKDLFLVNKINTLSRLGELIEVVHNRYIVVIYMIDT